MLIIGHKLIPNEKIYTVKSLEDIGYSIPNSTVVFNYDEELMSYCVENKINFGIYAHDIKSAIMANALGAKYILTMGLNAKKLQEIAENYMFDSKILQVIMEENEIEAVALNGIDGVIFENAIKGLL